MKLRTTICGNLEVFTYPVTQKQYKKVVGNNPSFHNKEKVGASTKNFPVTNVSAYEAEKFCKLLGEGWRLPTDEEWSFLAGSKLYSGSDDVDEVAVYNRENPTNVGSKQPNEFGLYDMSGLVWEWTSTEKHNYLILRGGSWCNNADNCEVSYCGNTDPDFRRYFLGFRPVRTI